MTTPLLRQTWTMSAVLINMFGQGLVLSYTTCFLPALNRPDSPIKVDIHTASLLSSIIGISGIPGFLISSVLMAAYGRRKTHAFVILPGVVGWLLIYFAQDITMLMMGRFLGGFTASATVSLGAIVIGEYTSPKYRGVFLYLKNTTVCIGAMFIHTVGHYLHWRLVALVAILPLFVALGIIYTWPESPAWLITKRKYKQSKENFYWLRGSDEDSQKEFDDMIKTQMSKHPKAKLRSRDKVMSVCRKFRQKDFLKPLVIMILATLVLEMSGRHVFPAYALQITSKMTGETTHSFYYALGIDTVITASAVLSAVLVKIMSRRTLLFGTGFTAVMILVLVCLYNLLTSNDIITLGHNWVPIVLLGLYFSFANFGCAPIPLALVGEVFPLAHKGIGSALSGVWISICIMAGLNSTPYLLANVGVNGFFAVYGTLLGIALFILYFILPETKDRTLQEIEYYFNCGKFEERKYVDVETDSKLIRNEIDGTEMLLSK